VLVRNGEFDSDNLFLQVRHNSKPAIEKFFEYRVYYFFLIVMYVPFCVFCLIVLFCVLFL
jgi:hypothetical protein